VRRSDDNVEHKAIQLTSYSEKILHKRLVNSRRLFKTAIGWS